MKKALQKMITGIQYIAPGPAVSNGPGRPSARTATQPMLKRINNEELAGIDVSDGHIHVAYVTQNEEGETVLERSGRASYALHESEESISRKIAALWKRCEIPTHLVTTCLHTRSLAIKHFKYTGLSDDDLHSALRLEAEEAMQLPPDEIVYDWNINCITGEGDDRSSSGILVSAPLRKIKRQLKMLRNASLYPVLIDTVPTATSNLYLALNGELESGESIALLNLSQHYADICILYNQDKLYPRSIYSHSGTWNENTDYLIETLQDALLYYHVKINRDPISKILLTGDLPKGDGLRELIEENTRITTRLWNPLAESSIRTAADSQAEMLSTVNQPLMSTCLGLALRREVVHD